ncbi:MAG: hypothetical protein ACK5KN_07515 [Dysgonomonas sp.]|uniref:hypothetical protein n=1 Tax=Dysgonomonas sp. TaxID=1891233 RepID=UPI003A87EBFE
MAKKELCVRLIVDECHVIMAASMVGLTLSPEELDKKFYNREEPMPVDVCEMSDGDKESEMGMTMALALFVIAKDAEKEDGE